MYRLVGVCGPCVCFLCAAAVECGLPPAPPRVCCLIFAAVPPQSAAVAASSTAATATFFCFPGRTGAALVWDCRPFGSCALVHGPRCATWLPGRHVEDEAENSSGQRPMGEFPSPRMLLVRAATAISAPSATCRAAAHAAVAAVVAVVCLVVVSPLSMPYTSGVFSGHDAELTRGCFRCCFLTSSALPAVIPQQQKQQQQQNRHH